jgi:hypothetical protein
MIFNPDRRKEFGRFSFVFADPRTAFRQYFADWFSFSADPLTALIVLSASSVFDDAETLGTIIPVL